MAKLILDMCCEIIRDEGGMVMDLEFEDATRFMEIQTGLDFKVVTESGSGGGWPVVSIIGSKEDIINYLRKFYCYDEDDVEFHSEYIIE
ncbi:hypothetical protein CkP1_0257 [Citrobacter phage CkP1]|nr:hypothetical protein CkP1_0257 [Citrobacter phage CkP1]